MTSLFREELKGNNLTRGAGVGVEGVVRKRRNRCSVVTLVRSPYRAPEPRNPETPKVSF